MSNTEQLSIQAVADRYFELAKIGRINQIQDELYSPTAVSIEPENRSNLPLRVQGIAAMREKEEKFFARYEEVHGGENGLPIVSGNFFACSQNLDVTMGGQRVIKEQMGIFEVRAGKIIQEQFFYND